ncbi:MAG: flagellar biosynthesis/type III secretory pathway protein [Lachnospiraceae bacterium]|jgi:flagellar assembly protein FliH|nr:flagellar biosynthesis/type III secretory pathway protein [Lachnospiraceae bacterium]
MISSSKRVIKRPDAAALAQQYIPPLELTLAGGEAVAKNAVFPHYSEDGTEKGEYIHVPRNHKTEAQPGEDGELWFTEEGLDSGKDPDAALREQWNQEAKKALEEAKKEAEEILEQAKEEAQQEFLKAREEGRQQGYEEGYLEGKKKGEEECRESFRQDVQEFEADIKQALRSVEIAKEKCVRTYLDELKDCAIAIGEKVIHISLRSSGEVIKQMIIAATEKLKKTAWVKIYIDKCDYDLMMEADADILDELSHLSDNIKFIVMDKEERGNCIIEMPEEIVDVSVNTQIENIKDILEHVRV